MALLVEKCQGINILGINLYTRKNLLQISRHYTIVLCIFCFAVLGNDSTEEVYRNNKFLTTEIYRKGICFKRELLKIRPTYITVSHSLNTSLNMDSQSHQRANIDTDQLESKYRLRCFPYFMLIGVPKSATSNLAVRIQRHPDIYNSISKELYWWNQFRFTINSSLSDYSDLFDFAVMQSVQNNSNIASYNPAIFGELTTLTLTDFAYWREAFQSPDGPPRITAHDIKDILPNTKFLLLLRNPTKRFYSLFNMKNRPPKIDAQDGPMMFHRKAVNSVRWWRNCTSSLPVRHCMYGSPPEVEPVETELTTWFSQDFNHTGCIREGMYVLYLKEWLQLFPRSQFLIMRSEDYMAHEVSTLVNSIFPFLGARNLTADERAYLELRGDKEGLSHYLPMWNETETILNEFYSSFNSDLADLLGDDKWLW